MSESDFLKTVSDYFSVGKKVVDEYCIGRDYPFMFPPAPSQQRIDFYRQSDIANEKKIADEVRLQSDYEAEVKIYRALEKLDEEIIVLHGLKYSHYQFRIWDQNHNPKDCSKKTQNPNCDKKNLHADEAEHDFIVIGSNYIVIIEVKNPSTADDCPIKVSSQTNTDPIQSAIRTAEKQFNKGLQIIEGIARESNIATGNASDFKVFQVVALPNLDCCSKLNSLDKSRFNFVSSKDLDSFPFFWDSLLLATSPIKVFSRNFDDVKSALVTLWATGKNQKIDHKKFSLTHCIENINKQLEHGEITFATEKRLPNPNVFKTCDLDSAWINGKNIFKDFLQIDYLTEEQKNAYEDESKNLIINGCAGSGKTIIMLARLIWLLLTEKSTKVVLIVHNEVKLARYSKIFERAGIDSREGDLNIENHRTTFNGRYVDLRQELASCSVLVVHLVSARRSFLEGIEDDFDISLVNINATFQQSVFSGNYGYTFDKNNPQSSNNRTDDKVAKSLQSSTGDSFDKLVDKTNTLSSLNRTEVATNVQSGSGDSSRANFDKSNTLSSLSRTEVATNVQSGSGDSSRANFDKSNTLSSLSRTEVATNVQSGSGDSSRANFDKSNTLSSLSRTEVATNVQSGSGDSSRANFDKSNTLSSLSRTEVATNVQSGSGDSSRANFDKSNTLSSLSRTEVATNVQSGSGDSSRANFDKSNTLSSLSRTEVATNVQSGSGDSSRANFDKSNTLSSLSRTEVATNVQSGSGDSSRANFDKSNTLSSLSRTEVATNVQSGSGDSSRANFDKSNTLSSLSRTEVATNVQSGSGDSSRANFDKSNTLSSLSRTEVATNVQSGSGDSSRANFDKSNTLSSLSRTEVATNVQSGSGDSSRANFDKSNTLSSLSRTEVATNVQSGSGDSSRANFDKSNTLSSLSRTEVATNVQSGSGDSSRANFDKSNTLSSLSRTEVATNVQSGSGDSSRANFDKSNTLSSLSRTEVATNAQSGSGDSSRGKFKLPKQFKLPKLPWLLRKLFIARKVRNKSAIEKSNVRCPP